MSAPLRAAQPPATREDRLADLLRRALPWVDAARKSFTLAPTVDAVREGRALVEAIKVEVGS